jgi:hypothetical protein
MGKLSLDQWSEIERRYTAGESARALEREFDVSEAAIRKRYGSQSAQVRTVANRLAEVQSELATLPPIQQAAAVSLAARMRKVSDDLAAAAISGAETTRKLSAIARKQVDRIDEADPMETQDVLQSISALTKMANDSSQIAVALINANKPTAPPQDEKPLSTLDVTKLSSAARRELLEARASE